MDRSAFFARGLQQMDSPDQSERRLEVKVMWGPVVLTAREFAPEAPNAVVSVGGRGAALNLPALSVPDGLELASPGGPDGFVIHQPAGARMQTAGSNDRIEDSEPPDLGRAATRALRLGERVRLEIGQLSFVFQYVQPARAVTTRWGQRLDVRMAKVTAMCAVIALGLWGALLATPLPEGREGDYLKNPARYASLIVPTKAVEKKTFDEIVKPKEPEKVEADDARWKKVTDRPSRNASDVPSKRKPEDDRKIATEAGILKLLKEHGGGGAGGGAIFGGVQASSLDDNLEGLRSTGMGPAGSFAGLGTRQGPGGGGPGLGIGGDWRRPGGPDGPGSSQISIPTGGRKKVVVDDKRTRVVGGLKPGAVKRVIQRYYSQIKHCYDSALGRAPNLYGKLTTNFVIAPTGRVGDASVLQSTLGDATVEACVLRTLRRIRFPEPRGGGEVIVTYPFLFTQAGN